VRGLTLGEILCTGGPESDPKGSMAVLQNQFRCPPIWEFEEPKGPKGPHRSSGPRRARPGLHGLLEMRDTHYPLGRSYAPRDRPTVGS